MLLANLDCERRLRCLQKTSHWEPTERAVSVLGSDPRNAGEVNRHGLERKREAVVSVLSCLEIGFRVAVEQIAFLCLIGRIRRSDLMLTTVHR